MSSVVRERQWTAEACSSVRTHRLLVSRKTRAFRSIEVETTWELSEKMATPVTCDGVIQDVGGYPTPTPGGN